VGLDASKQDDRTRFYLSKVSACSLHPAGVAASPGSELANAKSPAALRPAALLRVTEPELWESVGHRNADADGNRRGAASCLLTGWFRLQRSCELGREDLLPTHLAHEWNMKLPFPKPLLLRIIYFFPVKHTTSECSN
jgi:hypothetical protein